MNKLAFLLVTAVLFSPSFAEEPNAKQLPTHWNAGSRIGVSADGHDIKVLSGTGKLDEHISGAHLTGDVTADGKGGVIYSNVINGTTTSEYWDGVSMWKAGAILGIKNKGKEIGVISGTRKLD